MKARFILVVLSLLGLCCNAAGRKKPSNVPDGAVEVTFSKEGGWAHCWLDREINLNRCRTYNWRGERLYRPGHDDDADDVFLRYMGSGPVPETGLKIDPARTQVDFVWLFNGEVLLPRNDFAFQKSIVDKLLSTN